MSRKFPNRPAPAPLDREKLEALALHYVGRYATTHSRVIEYLKRKLIQRGWAGDDEAPVAAIVARLAELGYVDDASFAVARGAALARRGYGAARVAQALRAAGVEEAEAVPVRDAAKVEAAAAALAFARRRRIGPFAAQASDRDGERRALAAMMRAGHDYALARAIVQAAPGSDIPTEE